MKLSNKFIILTGASGGIGRILSKSIAINGGIVAMLSNEESELKKVFKEVKKHSPNSLYYSTDITDSNSVKDAIRYVNKTFPKIDVLINCAGIQNPIGLFYTNSFDLWKKNVETNLIGSICVISEVAKIMVEQRFGKIINFSGGGSTSSRPNFSAYAVSKTGIVRFTEILADELKEFNIDVNAVAPGAINTRMLDEVISANQLAGEELIAALKRKNIGGDNPENVAELICFLGSSDSDGITGKLISAQWDDWKSENFQNELKHNKDIATLRRIDYKYYTKKI
jgi:NAD(P)-dependent dehydrogenase (short-subunit alcohol dehydrogenase family)